MNNMRWLRLLAPYFAVGIFWVGFPHAWLAILVYHAQIILWHRLKWWVRSSKRENGKKCYNARTEPVCGRVACYLSLVSLLAGPLVYWIIPRVVLVDLVLWLEHYRMSGHAFFWMIPYFGVLHPILEQLHWHRLRCETDWAHVFFAGYHVVVLSSLLPVGWLIFCFMGLLGISWMWGQAGGSLRSRVLCSCSHIAADLGMILAVFLLVHR